MPKEIKVIEDFTNTVHRWNDETMESDELTLVGLHSLGKHVRISGNWEKFAGDATNKLPLAFETDIIRGKGVYYWPASQSIVDGSSGNYEYIVWLEYSTGDLKFYEIRPNVITEVLSIEIVADSFSSTPPTFTHNGNFLYWQFADGTSGVSTYINSVGPTWMGWSVPDQISGHLGQYHGTNLVNSQMDDGQSAYGMGSAVYWGNPFIRLLDGNNAQRLTVTWYDEANPVDVNGDDWPDDLDEDDYPSGDLEHPGFYGFSQTFYGGEGPIVWGAEETYFFQEFDVLKIYPLQPNVGGTYRNSKLVKGYKLWFKDNHSGDVILVMDIDFTNGVTHGSSGITNLFVSEEWNGLSYLETDYTSVYDAYPRLYTDETGLADPNMTESDLVNYKESSIFNNRRYAIGIDNNIYMSPINQVDVITLDMVVSNLAISGAPTYIEPLSSGLIVFTENSALIVEGEMDEEAGFFVVSKTSEMKGAGLSSKESLTKTDSGTVWGNENGIYIYKDDKAQILSDKLDAYWLQNEISAAPIVGYSSVFNQVVIWLGDNETYNFLVYDTTNDTFFVLDSNFNYEASTLYIPSFFTRSDGHLHNYYKDPTESAWFIGKYNELTSAEISGSHHTMILGNNDCGTPYQNKKFYRVIVTIFGNIINNEDIDITARIYNTRSKVLSTHTDSITSADEIILDCEGATGKSIGITIAANAGGVAEATTFGIDDVSIEYRGIGG